nr:MAG TPA: hypothetical protein [Caudoviricetes sp.]
MLYRPSLRIVDAFEATDALVCLVFDMNIPPFILVYSLIILHIAIIVNKITIYGIYEKLWELFVNLHNL